MTDRKSKVKSDKHASGVRKSVKHCDPLFPPCPDEEKDVAEFFRKPETERAYSEFLETICGRADDSQPVEQYDGTLGVTVSFVNDHQAPVGQLQWNNNLASIFTNPGNVSGVRWCTGTLISNDLFLTAGHCFDQTGGGWIRPKDNVTGSTIPSSEIATNMHVNFNYQVDPSGNLRVEQSFPILELVEYRLGGLDFAIVRLGGNPGSVFGTTDVSTTDASVGDMVCIIGHPAGVPKRIEAGPVTDLHGSRIGYNDIDTLGGNSGSGILRASDGRIVGVHTNGGCTRSDPNSDAGHNHGVRITSIISQSPTLQTLTTPTLKFIDDGPGTLKFIDDGGGTLKFVDDGGTLKFVDDGGGTLKFVDDSTLKAFDDQKHPALDKPPFGDHKIPGGDGRLPIQLGGHLTQPQQGTARPFILATPHHSMAWARGRETESATGEKQLLEQYEATILQLAKLIQEGSDELNQLNQQYQLVVAEYQALISGQQS